MGEESCLLLLLVFFVGDDGRRARRIRPALLSQACPPRVGFPAERAAPQHSRTALGVGAGGHAVGSSQRCAKTATPREQRARRALFDRRACPSAFLADASVRRRSIATPWVAAVAGTRGRRLRIFAVGVRKPRKA